MIGVCKSKAERSRHHRQEDLTAAAAAHAHDRMCRCMALAAFALERCRAVCVGLDLAGREAAEKRLFYYYL